MAAKKIKRFKFLIASSLLLLSIILFFGLNPKDFAFSNGVNWIEGHTGIHFEKYGMAYTEPYDELTGDNIANEFSIEIAFKPESNPQEGFNFLFAIHAGDDREQLLVGQYRSWIVIMNGDDYNHRRKTSRIAIDIASPNLRKISMVITAGKEGTIVYVDGQPVKTKRDLTLKLPETGNSRFVFGNSVYGRHSWMGSVYGFAFYRYALTAEKVKSHFYSWFRDERFLSAKEGNPFTLYLFDEKKGERVMDHGDGHNDLKVPSKMCILKKQILSLPWTGFELNKSLIQDVLLNLAGFIPLGFFLAATLLMGHGVFSRHAVLTAVIFCFIVSLAIEILQGWMPSRSSQLMDLILNTLGAFIGAVVCRFWFLAEGTWKGIFSTERTERPQRREKNGAAGQGRIF